MLTTVLVCQQRILFKISPAKIQMIKELVQRGSDIIIFLAQNIEDNIIKNASVKVYDTRCMSKVKIKNRIKCINPDIVICFTAEDTEICYSLPYVMKNTAFYYYNLEIYVPSPKKQSNIYGKIADVWDYREKKTKEMLYVYGCKALTVQDELRKKILKKHGISHPNTWLIPNSYYYDDNIYDIPHKGGVIYSGSLSSVMIGNLIECLTDLEGIELTLAGWGKIDSNAERNPNIKIVQQKLSQEEYTSFISAYDIALVWYSNHENDNEYNIGLSSGKFFKHLSIGQPIIVNEVPGLADEVRKYKLGVVISDIKELKDAIRVISSNYEEFVHNIRRVYQIRYDFKKTSKDFFDYIIEQANIKNKDKG